MLNRQLLVFLSLSALFILEAYSCHHSGCCDCGCGGGDSSESEEHHHHHHHHHHHNSSDGHHNSSSSGPSGNCSCSHGSHGSGEGSSSSGSSSSSSGSSSSSSESNENESSSSPSPAPTSPAGPSSLPSSPPPPSSSSPQGPSSPPPTSPAPSSTTSSPPRCAQCTLDTITLTPGDVSNRTATPITDGVQCCDANGCSTLNVTCIATSGSLTFMQFNHMQGGPVDPIGTVVDALLNCNPKGQWVYAPKGLASRLVTEVNCVLA